MHITETKALREVTMRATESLAELAAKCTEFDGAILPFTTGGLAVLQSTRDGVNSWKAVCGFRSREAAAKFDKWRGGDL